MKATIFLCLKTAFAIIGTVIGAGFITGREIITFFHGINLIYSVIMFFIFFTVAICFLLNAKNLQKLKIHKFFQPLILFGNLIILSGMLSALDDVFFEVTKIPFNLPFFSIIMLIISNVVVSKGVEGLKVCNTFLVPLMLVVTAIILFFFGSNKLVVFSNFNIKNVVLYIGMNTFMSSTVFNDLGETLTLKQSIFTSIIVSAILCLMIFGIELSLNGCDKSVIDSNVPLLSMLRGRKNIKTIFSLVVVIGIITTLFSSHYPLFLFCENFKKANIAKVTLSVVAFAISRMGFYNIVNYLYPLLGVIGVVYLLITSILLVFFPKEQ